MCAGCGDDVVCGPGEAPVDGVTASAGGTTVEYGAFTSSPNNDCPPPGGGPTSLTIDGEQIDPQPAEFTFNITFCLPRPDAIRAGDAIPLGLEGDELLQIINLGAEPTPGADPPCDWRLDSTVPPTGTVTFEGYCDDGLGPEGYAITLDAQVGLIDACTGTNPTATLGGTVRVEAINL